MTLRERLLSFLRVPHEPAAPAGDQDIHVFRAAPNFLRYRLAQWALRNVGALAGLLFALRFTGRIDNMLPGRFDLLGIPFTASMITTVIYLLEAGAVLGFAVQAVWSFLLLRLDFEQRWYIVSDRSLRIREGLVRLHEKTMTFANVQNVSVKQGPLQRLLGIADVEVRSAGGGSHSEAGESDKAERHVAYFRGVDNAEAIRDAIRDRLRVYRDAGLGDPDDVAQQPSAPLLESAQALAREARLARLAVTSR